MTALRFALIVLVPLGGCFVVPEPPSNSAPVAPSPPSSTPSYLIVGGADTSLSPGVQIAYGITSNGAGGYRLVWTGDYLQTGVAHEFQGSVYTSGTFTSYVPGCQDSSCPLESDDWMADAPSDVSGGGRQIDWDTIATDGLDGLDFAVSSEPVIFDLSVDGVRQPSYVVFPVAPAADLASVSSIPFALKSS
jgi:hypothetical protein